MNVTITEQDQPDEGTYIAAPDLQAPGPSPDPGTIANFAGIVGTLEAVIGDLRQQFNPNEALVTAIRALETGRLWLYEAARPHKERI